MALVLWKCLQPWTWAEQGHCSRLVYNLTHFRLVGVAGVWLQPTASEAPVGVVRLRVSSNSDFCPVALADSHPLLLGYRVSLSHKDSGCDRKC